MEAMTKWTTADIMSGKMLVGGPRRAKFCPECGSENVTLGGTWSDPSIKCADCGAKFGGASARA